MGESLLGVGVLVVAVACHGRALEPDEPGRKSQPCVRPAVDPVNVP